MIESIEVSVTGEASAEDNTVLVDYTELKKLVDSVNPDCGWEKEESGAYLTECDNIFIITEGTPGDNQMEYCCYCGGKLKS